VQDAQLDKPLFGALDKGASVQDHLPPLHVGPPIRLSILWVLREACTKIARLSPPSPPLVPLQWFIFEEMPSSFSASFLTRMGKPQVKGYIYKILQGASSDEDVEVAQEFSEKSVSVEPRRLKWLRTGLLICLWLFTAFLLSRLIPLILNPTKPQRQHSFFPEGNGYLHQKLDSVDNKTELIASSPNQSIHV
jgi:hypothetical protein